MSQLDELIQEFCPNGVKYKRFDEACSLHARIGWQRLTRAEYKESGNYMLITGTDFTDLHEINYDSCVYVSEDRYVQDPHIQLKNVDILITKDGTLGKVAQVKNLPMPATLNGGVFVVRCKDDSLENCFIMHYLLSDHFQNVVEQQKTGSTISHLTQALFSRLRIPVPPLEVQREIVRILDNFTELTARKKQYEFYRDKLLTFDIASATISGQTDGLIKLFQYVFGIAYVKLSDIATITRGGSFQKKDFCDDGVPCIYYGQIYTCYGLYADKTIQCVSEAVAKKSKKAVKNDIVIAVTSENVEDVCKCVTWLGDEDIAVSGHTAIIHHNQNAKYLSYYFHTSQFFEQKKGSPMEQRL